MTDQRREADQREAVNHPEHYGGSENPYEAIKVIRAWALGFSLGNAVKYIARVGKKPGESEIRDLEKARWYLDEEIAHLKKKQETRSNEPEDRRS